MLRERFYGSAAYDFSERSEIGLTRGFSARGKTEAALAFFKMNMEFAPESSIANFWMGYYYLSQSDTVMARIYMGESLKLNPDNKEIRRLVGTLN